MKLKRRTKISLVVILVIIVLYHYGFFYRFNYLTAQIDILNSRPRIVNTGPPMNLTESMISLNEKYGVYLCHIHCDISWAESNGINSYSSEIEKYLIKRNGENWREKYYKEFKSLFNKSLIFSQLEIGKEFLYTGGRKLTKEGKITNGIYIKRVSRNLVEYSFSELINWKKKFEKKGIAKLKTTSDSIIMSTKDKELCYKFVDSENDIIIYITQREMLNMTEAKVFNKAGEQISVLMYYK
ncbi:hypothetical protein [Tenacibaculum aiptasiae]|uniref:FEKKY domain-containing protein n=1 Tax=Tenacibaculum aiptasiae TaxID=426481 RepID=UPI00232F9253|nr:hypothetical protein [Tenacibaculum aiptasiae]